jgi:FkbM family methyltransferase
MRFSKFNLKLVKKWGWFRRRFLRSLIAQIADPQKRREVNEEYNKMGPASLSLFHRLFAKMFRDEDQTITAGEWKVFFMNKPILLPLRQDMLWLDWDIAVSVTGHDPDIKKTYENFIRSGRIKTFFDIGANYGTHSLFFLINGIKTVAFEPNSTLKKEFDLYCSMNNVKGTMETLALGDKNGMVRLSFQSHDTWNGSIVESTVASFKGEQVQTLEVPLTTLDDYIAKTNLNPDLVKIDTEGNEINVLNGAVKTLSTLRPTILFETNNFAERQDLWNYFKATGYSVYALPYSPDSNDKLLSQEQFFTSGANNYVAAPSSK